MHWLLVRLLRIAADVVPAKEIRSALNAHFRPVALAAEAEFVSSRDGLGERPYGWGWALALVHEAQSLDDPDGKKWAAALQPLADAVTGCFLDWLPKATYPVRYGVHENSAFGLARALDYAHAQARAGDRALLEAITDKAYDLVQRRHHVPGRLGAVRARLPVARAGRGRADGPDTARGRVRHLAVGVPARDRRRGARHAVHPGRGVGPRRRPDRPPARAERQPGLVLAPDRRIAAAGDPRIGPAVAAARTHAGAALPHVVGDDYMVEHWLACYAVLMLS